jgi:hypothetical protein
VGVYFQSRNLFCSEYLKARRQARAAKRLAGWRAVPKSFAAHDFGWSFIVQETGAIERYGAGHDGRRQGLAAVGAERRAIAGELQDLMAVRTGEQHVGLGLGPRKNNGAAALILLTSALEKQQASRRVYS